MTRESDGAVTIIEEEGPCACCGQIALLGNGVCMKCWDRGTRAPL